MMVMMMMMMMMMVVVVVVINDDDDDDDDFVLPTDPMQLAMLRSTAQATSPPQDPTCPGQERHEETMGTA